MCGITGVFNFSGDRPVQAEHLSEMNGAIRHRGPDDEGIFLEGGIGLAMRRLSVIDLSTGHQPVSNENGTVWIVFNGEIYNFRALREWLQGKGHSFKTNTDTETIVHAYEELGPSCVSRLRGMFAFALWDKDRQRLLLARDRFGKKPLVYSVDNGTIAWASEIQALVKLPGLRKEMDAEALDLYLGLQYIPSPHTIFKQIRKLPPAHILTVENGNIRTERYWELPLDRSGPEVSFEDAKSAIREKLAEAVRIRMISDVPLGAFLSGGIDSSIIVALMSRVSDKPVKTFSIGFEEQEFSELDYARQTADLYGTRHTEFIVKPEMTGILPLLVKHYGEPYADNSALPTYFVARETRKFVTVALNGDGGDENFAGYQRFARCSAAGFLDTVPVQVRRALGAVSSMIPGNFNSDSLTAKIKRRLLYASGDAARRYFRHVGVFSDEDKTELYSFSLKEQLRDKFSCSRRYIETIFKKGENLDFVNRMLFTDFSSYLPECLMTKVDIASMANSLEARSPFLDHEFAEMVFKMPGEWKLKGGSRAKYILKEAMRDILPETVVKRGKMGFGIPFHDWFRGRLKDYWREHVLSTKALSRNYFNKQALGRIFDDHVSGRRDDGLRMWTLLMLELWHEEFLPDGMI